MIERASFDNYRYDGRPDHFDSDDDGVRETTIDGGTCHRHDHILPHLHHRYHYRLRQSLELMHTH